MDFLCKFFSWLYTPKQPGPSFQDALNYIRREQQRQQQWFDKAVAEKRIQDAANFELHLLTWNKARRDLEAMQ
ncbi:hypothetical protein [Hymenobacter metallicola]|uniref:Uncharacterized protein n=1 Tax=Hymenobacter metallicola TaxID=2563114 RepID=A0A4Z0QL55_9BACT|nr:hypothetical protein [Hymenobacter metallicola]TGE29781.1 hypothetical protein E5K02_10065 [Hymenobacter metallicola]